MFIAECAPSHQRGKLVTVNNICITGGQFIASIVAGAFSHDYDNGWRYLFSVNHVIFILWPVGHITHLARLSVCLSVRPSVLYELGTQKPKM